MPVRGSSETCECSAERCQSTEPLRFGLALGRFGSCLRSERADVPLTKTLQCLQGRKLLPCPQLPPFYGCLPAELCLSLLTEALGEELLKGATPSAGRSSLGAGLGLPEPRTELFLSNRGPFAAQQRHDPSQQLLSRRVPELRNVPAAESAPEQASSAGQEASFVHETNRIEDIDHCAAQPGSKAASVSRDFGDSREHPPKSVCLMRHYFLVPEAVESLITSGFTPNSTMRAFSSTPWDAASEV